MFRSSECGNPDDLLPSLSQSWRNPDDLIYWDCKSPKDSPPRTSPSSDRDSVAVFFKGLAHIRQASSTPSSSLEDSPVTRRRHLAWRNFSEPHRRPPRRWSPPPPENQFDLNHFLTKLEEQQKADLLLANNPSDDEVEGVPEGAVAKAVDEVPPPPPKEKQRRPAEVVASQQPSQFKRPSPSPIQTYKLNPPSLRKVFPKPSPQVSSTNGKVAPPKANPPRVASRSSVPSSSTTSSYSRPSSLPSRQPSAPSTGFTAKPVQLPSATQVTRAFNSFPSSAASSAQRPQISLKDGKAVPTSVPVSRPSSSTTGLRPADHHSKPHSFDGLIARFREQKRKNSLNKSFSADDLPAEPETTTPKNVSTVPKPSTTASNVSNAAAATSMRPRTFSLPGQNKGGPNPPPAAVNSSTNVSSTEKNFNFELLKAKFREIRKRDLLNEAKRLCVAPNATAAKSTGGSEALCSRTSSFSNANQSGNGNGGLFDGLRAQFRANKLLNKSVSSDNIVVVPEKSTENQCSAGQQSSSQKSSSQKADDATEPPVIKRPKFSLHSTAQPPKIQAPQSAGAASTDSNSIPSFDSMDDDDDDLFLSLSTGVQRTSQPSEQEINLLTQCCLDDGEF